jgi:uncharacterized protein YjbI with pentapeptide repeats
MDFRGAILVQTNFGTAKLDGADLRGAILRREERGEGFREAILHRTSLEGALYDSSTRWPAGVDPRKQGAINLDEQGWLRKARQWIKDRGSDIFG